MNSWGEYHRLGYGVVRRIVFAVGFGVACFWLGRIVVRWLNGDWR